MIPNFLIIGAQKSASTFVHECVREHPDVFMPRQEIAYFQDPDYLETSISRFESIFDAVKSEKAIGIKCPDYLGRPECPERIHKHIPDARLIVVLRDPVARAVSAYYWFMQVGIIPVRPLEEGFGDLINGRYDRRFPRSREIIDYGYYYQHLMRYLKYFDESQLLILLQSDLQNSPREAISQIYRFLEIDEGYISSALGGQPKQSVYSLHRLKWLSMANRLFFYSYRVSADNMMALYPIENKMLRLCYYMMQGIDRHLLTYIFGNKKEKLGLGTRNALVEKYIDDINSLEKYLGKELAEWKQMT